MGASNSSTWKEGDWSKMGLQDKELKRRGGEIQSKIGG